MNYKFKKLKESYTKEQIMKWYYKGGIKEVCSQTNTSRFLGYKLMSWHNVECDRKRGIKLGQKLNIPKRCFYINFNRAEITMMTTLIERALMDADMVSLTEQLLSASKKIEKSKEVVK